MLKGFVFLIAMECANVFETPKKRKAVECAGDDPDTPKSLVELREEKDFAKEIQKKEVPTSMWSKLGRQSKRTGNKSSF